MSTKPPSKVVFVGNIPYGLSEEQIIEIFSGAGKVLNFRLVYDRDTGRPKGFGFAEYPDADSASSAVRNLNDYEIMNRKLRVDFSNEPGTVTDDGNTTTTFTNGAVDQFGRTVPLTNTAAADYAPAASATNGTIPPLPAGRDLPPGITCADAISRTLNTLPPAQLLDILSSMKSLSTTDPARAMELLAQAPQLSYAIFQALLLMGLVSPEAINSVLETSAGGIAPPPAMAMPVTNTPPVLGGPYGVPQPMIAAPVPTPVPAPAPAPIVAVAAGAQDPDALLAQVMALPQEVIDALPAGEREQLLALRATYAGAAR